MADVTQPQRLERIIVVPRNGYANRLQAWACASIMADELQVPLSVMWEPQPVAGASASVLFSEQAVSRSFMSQPELTALLGTHHDSLPRYLHSDPGHDFLSLAGHDKGEQAFMSTLEGILQQAGQPSALVLIAGGLFALPRTSNFELKRRHFYRNLPWNESIVSRAQELLAGRDPYLGVHIRQTDRSIDAPTVRQITRALLRLRDASDITSLFIAADSNSAMGEWTERTVDMGFFPWSVPDQSRNRSDQDAGLDAIVDWQLLSQSQGMVYTRASSFGHEACVASGAAAGSLGLAAPFFVKGARQVRRHTRHALVRIRNGPKGAGA